MNALVSIALASVCAAASTRAEQPRPASHPTTAPGVRFVALDVLIDSKAEPLAAYQFELKALGADFAIVGVEGGKHRAFAKPPYYDPKALSRNRIIIAAFNTGRDLPTGKTRVARIHARVVGPKDPKLSVSLTVAATRDGRSIPATAAVSPAVRPGEKP